MKHVCTNSLGSKKVKPRTVAFKDTCHLHSRVLIGRGLGTHSFTKFCHVFIKQTEQRNYRLLPFSPSVLDDSILPPNSLNYTTLFSHQHNLSNDLLKSDIWCQGYSPWTSSRNKWQDYCHKWDSWSNTSSSESTPSVHSYRLITMKHLLISKTPSVKGEEV